MVRTVVERVLPTAGGRALAHLRGAAVGRHPLPIAEPATYRTAVGSRTADLPLVRMSEDVTIALLICVDHGVAFSERAGRELAELLAPASPEVVVSVATMGIPLAIEVTRALGLDDYVILHKTPKIHLGNTYVEPVQSITTGSPQTLRLDPARVDAIRGRRVAVVDDVISTGRVAGRRAAPAPPGRCRPGRHRRVLDGGRRVADAPRRGCRPRPDARVDPALRGRAGRDARRGLG